MLYDHATHSLYDEMNDIFISIVSVNLSARAVTSMEISVNLQHLEGFYEISRFSHLFNYHSFHLKWNK